MGIGGIVLAAGRSERMGAAKPLLEVDGRTFVEAATGALREGGCDRVVVVIADRAVEAAVRATGAGVALVPTDGEQIDSLRAGLAALSGDVGAAVVLPVDHPLVTGATVRSLIAAHREHPDAVTRPTRGGRPGHPTLFPAPVWPRLLEVDLEQGARGVLAADDVAVVDVPVPDEGVLADIDTPEQYDRWIGS